MFKNEFKFGITNYGDAAKDLSWTGYMNILIGAVVKSRYEDVNFTNALLRFKDKVIYQAVITGLGGTEFEKDTPKQERIFNQIKYLIYHGFPVNQIIIRIDPILPDCWIDAINERFGIDYIQNIIDILNFAKEMKITRIKHEFLNFYPHVLNRMKLIDERFSISADWKYDPMREICLKVMDESFIYETTDAFYPYSKFVTEVSNEDLMSLKKYDKFRFSRFEDYDNNILEIIRKIKKESFNYVYSPVNVKPKYFDFEKNKVSEEYKMHRDYTIFPQPAYCYYAFAKDVFGRGAQLEENKETHKFYAEIKFDEPKIVTLEDFKDCKWLRYIFE